MSKRLRTQPLALPIASSCGPPGAHGKPRPSRVSRWRALVLTLIYVGMAAHFAHWWFAGRTVSPIEPSEAMYTLEQGLLNAGFVTLLVGIVSTLVLGRWFCGWGCHIIAVQDLCTWLLKKMHLRLKPFRSRLLIFVPLGAALYMFVWPSVARYAVGDPPPALIYHFLTYDFWKTFPGPFMSIFTLLAAGFLVVVLLGNKGYCTYACPYGGFFGVADRVAVGRIRVTDACNQCGHCTATCTSNVRVHEEVARYGMVVDPGCMKCTDCISVCPNDALYFGFGRPELLKRAVPTATPPRRREFDYAWPEEVLLGGVFLVALYAYRGLYDAVPLLLALGLASVSAYLLVQTLRLTYSTNVRVHTLLLKLKGRTTASGWGFAAFGTLLAAFVTHSAVLQYNMIEGERMVDAASAKQAGVAAGEHDAVAALSRSALAHLEWVERFALAPLPSVSTQIGSLSLYLNDLDGAERHLRRALRWAPDYGAAHYKWGEVLARRGQREQSVRELERAVELDPGLADARRDLAGVCRQEGRLDDAVAMMRRVVERRPQDYVARFELAGELAETGHADEATTHMREVVRQQPRWAAGHARLGTLLAAQGETDNACRSIARAIELDPRDPRMRLLMATIEIRAARPTEAASALEEAREAAPLDPDVLRAWAAGLVQIGRAEAAVRLAEASAPSDLRARYALCFLYHSLGMHDAAQREFGHIIAMDPTLPAP